jgi:hypothetical protein
VKLVASMFCVAALSLIGCVDEPTGGGGQLEGLRPAKPTFDDPDVSPTGANTDVNNKNAQLPPHQLPVDTDGFYGHLGGVALPPEPAPEICPNCEVTAIRLPEENSYGIDEVRVVSDGGLELCRIYLDDSGYVFNECFTPEP